MTVLKDFLEGVSPFADEQGYLWCPCCEKQLPASLWCESCEAFAHEHPPAVSLEEWKARVILELEAKQNPDGSWSVAA
jgi:hypothetical protein